MVSLISSEDKTKLILDPGAGKGIFLEALKSAGFNNIKAYEIDEDLFKIVNGEFKDFKIEMLDFLNNIYMDWFY